MGVARRKSRQNTVAPSNGASSGVVAAAAGRKNLGWLGTRRRQDRWAAEIRMPRTRDKLWIGTFSTPEQAALAYDAAVFCLYGALLPASRKLNFPTAPRPNIPEHVRVRLTAANIKAIAEKYSRSLAVYLVPAPLMVEAAVVEPATVATAHAGSAITANHGNMNDRDMTGVDAVEDFFFSFYAEEYEHLMTDIFDDTDDSSS